MKRHASTIALLVVTVLFAIWLWLDKSRVSEGERRERENDVFFAWRRDEVSRLEIVREGETIVLERESADKPWRMTAPRAERADQAAADRLFSTLEFAHVVRKVGEGNVVGFDAPRATGSVTMGKLVFRFVLGGPSPRPEGSSYFRIDDRAPFVVSKELTDALLAPSDTYRDRTVVPYLSQEVARLEVRGPRTGFVLERKDERSFLVQGAGVRASRTALDKVWAALAEMRAEAFLKEADAERLTKEPALTIRLTPKEAGKPAGELVVGDTCPGHPSDVVVLRTQPTRVLACAPKGAMDALEGIEPAVLVDRRPFTFRHDEIEELRLESLDERDAGGGPRVLELARRGNGFHQREPVDRELSQPEADAVSELLARIEDGTAESVSPAGEAFVAVARARVRSGELDEVVEVGPAEGATVTLRRLHDGARLVVTRALVRRLVPRATSTRPRTLLAETRRVTRVALQCGTTQELVDAGAGLRLVQPSGYETDGSITQLVDGLVRGNVLLWVADGDEESERATGNRPQATGNGFGLGPDACSVTLGFADGAPVTVRFGAEGEGGIYGRVDGHPEVFVAPLALGELARRIYVSHAGLRVPPERIDSVRVVAQGRPVTAVAPERLRDAAGALFADDVVALGAPDVGKVDVDISVTVAEGGPPKRIACGAATTTPTGSWRRCATPDVKAVFAVRAAAIDAFVRSSPADAGRD